MLSNTVMLMVVARRSVIWRLSELNPFEACISKVCRDSAAQKLLTIAHNNHNVVLSLCSILSYTCIYYWDHIFVSAVGCFFFFKLLFDDDDNGRSIILMTWELYYYSNFSAEVNQCLYWIIVFRKYKMLQKYY